LTTSSIFSRTFVGVGTYSMSGTVFGPDGASATLALGAADADAVATGALLAAGGVDAAVVAVAVAVVVGPELVGAPVPVEVPDGVHAAARARTGRRNERGIVVMTARMGLHDKRAVKSEAIR